MEVPLELSRGAPSSSWMELLQSWATPVTAENYWVCLWKQKLVVDSTGCRTCHWQKRSLHFEITYLPSEHENFVSRTVFGRLELDLRSEKTKCQNVRWVWVLEIFALRVVVVWKPKMIPLLSRTTYLCIQSENVESDRKSFESLFLICV